jgi:exodeoxyribonuclease V beta subunit
MDELIARVPGINSELIETIDYSNVRFVPAKGRYKPGEDAIKAFSPRQKPDQLEIKNTFGIHSYSELKSAHFSAPFEKADLGTPDDYNQFIFQDLGRGANVGIALHAIFERLDFAGDESSWRNTLKDASKYWRNIVKEDKEELFMGMLDNVMNADISIVEKGFTLKKINSVNKLPELEFYFSLDRKNKEEINRLLGDEADLSGKADIEGLMTGSIDLLFERNGKYYILDWKSNHLGNSIQNYDKDSMDEAMKGSSYDLQYMIYTVAVVRWLKSRIAGFDYEKHFGGVIYVFLRGARKGMETGIWKTRPEVEVINNLDVALKVKNNGAN